MDKIKPCPFCGSESEVEVDFAVMEDDMCSPISRSRYYIECANDEHCGANNEGYYCFNQEDAIEKWNKRATELEL